MRGVKNYLGYSDHSFVPYLHKSRTQIVKIEEDDI